MNHEDAIKPIRQEYNLFQNHVELFEKHIPPCDTTLLPNLTVKDALTQNLRYQIHLKSLKEFSRVFYSRNWKVTEWLTHVRNCPKKYKDETKRALLDEELFKEAEAYKYAVWKVDEEIYKIEKLVMVTESQIIILKNDNGYYIKTWSDDT